MASRHRANRGDFIVFDNPKTDMPNEFDPYREALVLEHRTVWPEELDDLEPTDRSAVEEKLHSMPDEAEDLIYERTHTGFCRQITVTESDLRRVD